MFGGCGDESMTPVAVRQPIWELTPQKVKNAINDIIETIDDADVKVIEAKLAVVASGASAFQAAEAAQLAAAPVFDPKDAPMVGQLQSALADGAIDIRSNLGQQFCRYVKKDEDGMKGYALCKTHEAKKKFRLDWAERRLNDLRVTRTHERAYRSVDETKGVYVSFGTLVESYGVHYDKAAAISAALRYAAKCVQMGGKWVGFDEMAEVQEFLKLRKEHSEIMEESWRLCEEEISKRSLEDKAEVVGVTHVVDKAEVGGTPVMDKADVLRVKPVTDKAVVVTPAASTSGKKQKTAAKAAADTPKKRSKLDEAIVLAVAVKKKYLALHSSATSLENEIQNDGKWMWARTNSAVGQLVEAKSACEKLLDDGDIRRFVFEEFKTLRIELGADTLLLMIERFNMLKPKVDHMDAVIKKLLDAHKNFK
jgi:hypothetical protein